MPEEEPEPSAPFWMTTFSDMVTLLLTFFVLIVSMSEVEVKKFQEALSYFQGSVGVLAETASLPSPNQVISIQAARERAEQYETLLEYLDQNGLEEKVQVNLTENGFHVVMNDSVMFLTGEAELIEPARTVLRLVSQLLTPKVQAVVVEGHTDDKPIRTLRFPSNWELSSARAASVVRFLLDQPDALPAERYVSIGYGEHRPVDTNATATGRAHNRRVEIFFSWTTWLNGTAPPNLIETPTP